MAAPMAKGIVIATTLLLAAGLAAYENEQIRNWIEAQRRKIAVVLTGQDAPGGYGSASAQLEKERERQAGDLALELRDEVIRRHREEIFERARKEGVAVDLDELNAVERLYEEQEEIQRSATPRPHLSHGRKSSAQSFDELVGCDGMLKSRDVTAKGISTGSAATVEASSGVRQRGWTGLARGMSFANPFEDEIHQTYDQEIVAAGGEELAGMLNLHNTSQAIAEPEPDLASLVDVHEDPYKSDQELEAEIEEAIRRSLRESEIESHLDQVKPAGRSEMAHVDGSGDVTTSASLQNSIYQSYYYGSAAEATRLDDALPSMDASNLSFRSAHTDFQSPGYSSIFHIPHPSTLTTQNLHSHHEQDTDDNLTPAGTLTPTTEAGFSIDSDSLYGEASVNFGDLLGERLQEHRDQDGQSRFADDGEESDAFSVVDGIHTPGSWTDVESVGGYDEDFVTEGDGLSEEARRSNTRESTSSTLR